MANGEAKAVLVSIKPMKSLENAIVVILPGTSPVLHNETRRWKFELPEMPNMNTMRSPHSLSDLENT